MLSFRQVKNGSFLAPGLALIFDMDGVLVDSTAMHTRAWDLYLERLGIKEEGLMDRMLGKRNDEIVRALLGADLPEDEVFQHGAAKEQLYRDLMDPVFEAHVVPGVREFVRKAAEKGIPLGLATNAEPRNVEFVLRRAGLEGAFQSIVDGHQVENPKPFPDVYFETARRLRIDPANCIIFEDSPGGMKAAQAAGARLVAILTTVPEAPEARLAIPDFNDERLLPWLTSQTPRLC
jgi:HAD superfamily hydrolase (TIGR01509 family)